MGLALTLAALSSGCGDEEFAHRYGGPNAVAPDVLEPCPERSAAPITCTSEPELCRRQVETVLAASSGVRPVRLLFVAEGYTEADIAFFRTRVSGMLEEALVDDESLIAQLGPALEVQLLPLVSVTDDLFDDVGIDTVFGGCLREGFDGSARLRSDHRRARFTAARHGVDADVVLVVHNSSVGRANAELPLGYGEPGQVAIDLRRVEPAGAGASRAASFLPPVVELARVDTGAVLDHELGHALVHLRDEYTTEEGCYQPVVQRGRSGPFVFSPNLTEDPTGARWQHLVEGAVEGGAQRSSCVFHPTSSCRMLQREATGYCPVCSDAVRKVVAARTTNAQDGGPTCELDVTGRAWRNFDDQRSLTLGLVAHDENLPLTLSLLIDGEVVDRVVSARNPYPEARVELTYSDAASQDVLLLCRDGLGRTTERRSTLTALFDALDALD